MHADVSVELERHAAQSIRAQQKACDAWRVEFNHVRPHEAIGLQTPADVYCPSPRRMMRVLVGFPEGAEILEVDRKGRVWFDRRYQVFVSTALVGMHVGFERADDGFVRVWLHRMLIGQFHIGPTLGRYVSVQPLPKEDAKPGDRKGDTTGDTAGNAAAGVSPLSASDRSRLPLGLTVEGDTGSCTPSERSSPTEEGGFEGQKAQIL